jgi:hypothetical protein
MNLFEDINVNTIHYKFDQNWINLTDTDPIVAFFYGRIEYIIYKYAYTE